VKRFAFLPKFLGAAFAEVAAAGCDKFGSFLWAYVFSNADERDVARAATGLFAGVGDSLLDTLEVIGEGHGSCE
jgi:hypothetical protein